MLFILAFIFLLILPGFCLVSLLAPNLPWVQRLPAGFVASLALLGLPAVLLLNLHAPLTTLAWLSLPTIFIPTTLYLHKTFTNHQADRSLVGHQPNQPINPITQLPNYQSSITNYLTTNYKLLIPTILLIAAALYLFLTTAAIRDFGDHWFYLTFIRHYLDLPLDPGLNPLTGINVSSGNLSRAATNGWWVIIALLVQVSGQPLLESYWLILPPLLMLVSITAFYALAWELFENHKAALSAVLLQLLLYLTSISSHDWIGQGFFTRIAEDKYLVWLVLLPAAFFLLLRFLKRSQWQTLALLTASVAAIAITHQFGLLQFAFAAACFALVYLPLNRHKVSKMQTVVLLAPLALFLIIPIIQLLLPAAIALTQFIPFEIQTPPNDTHLMVLSAESQRYLLHPHSLFHPLTLLAILLSPLLLRSIKQSTTAQFLFATTILPIVLLYNPITAPLLGRFLSPLLLWRTTWIIPTTLLLAFVIHTFTPRLKTLITNHQSPILKLAILILILAATRFLGLYALDGIDLLQDYKTRIVTADEQALLQYLCEKDGMAGVVIADPRLNTILPACTPQAELLTYRIFQSQPNAAETIDRFYNGRLFAQSSLTFLDDWQARYIILPNQVPIAAQISRLPDLFTEMYINKAYVFYEYHPTNHPIVAGNEAFIQGNLDQAQSLYSQASGSPTLAEYGLGLVSQTKGDLETAETHFLNALATDPTFPSPYVALAEIYQQDGRLNDAKSILLEAVSHIPDNRLIHETLGDVYLELSDDQAAAEQYRQSIPPESNEADAQLALAKLYSEKGLMIQSFAAYQGVFEAEKILLRLSGGSSLWYIWGRSLTFDRRADRLAEALGALGQYYERQEQDSTAEFVYRQLIDLQPTRESSYEPLAVLYRRTGRQDDLVTLYSKAVRANFHLSWPYRQLAAAFLAEYRRSDDWEPLVKEAIKKLESAQRIEPDNVEGYKLLAQANDLLGRPQEIERLYQEAAEKYTWEAWPLVALGQYYLENGTFSAAQDALTTAIDRKPADQTAYNLLAEAYLNRDETAEAIQLYQQAIDANKNSAWPHLGLANALLAAGRTGEALDAMVDGLSREPDNPAVYSTIGNIYRWNVGDPETAVTYYNQSLALNPNQPDVHMALASTYVALGQEAEALAQLDTALSQSSQTATDFQTAGDLMWQLGRLEDAEQYYRQALSIDPKTPAAHLGLARIYQQQGNLDQALEHTQQAVLISDNNQITAQAQIIQAQIFLATGRSDEAWPLIQAAIDAFPADPWYQATAGDYYQYHQNNPDLAVPYYRRAAELAPQQAILQAALGTALYDAGQTAEALPYMEQAITLAPSDPNIYLRIGSVLIKYADWEQLIQYYETAVANGIENPDINAQLANAYAAIGK